MYWQAIYEFSKSLNETMELMTGQDIDYFKVLRERLDLYVDTMEKYPKAPEPARVIGAEFAQLCGNVNDLFAFMAGSKMFLSVHGRVREYLEKLGWI
jgi:hypothetical protein